MRKTRKQRKSDPMMIPAIAPPFRV